MRRREFIAGLGSAAAWPVVARAQQPAVPVIGYLSSRSPDADAAFVAAFRQGLKDAGQVEGQSFTIEFRWANNETAQLPALAADLVGRRVSVMAAITGNAPALAAQAATPTIPIVFNTGDDPVRLGLVASLNRPGGNVTGVANLAGELTPKQLELLCAAVPNAAVIASLRDGAADLESYDRRVEAAARLLGRRIAFLRADTEREIDDAFANLSQLRADALLVRQTLSIVALVLFASSSVGYYYLRYLPQRDARFEPERALEGLRAAAQKRAERQQLASEQQASEQRALEQQAAEQQQLRERADRYQACLTHVTDSYNESRIAACNRLQHSHEIMEYRRASRLRAADWSSKLSSDSTSRGSFPAAFDKS